MHWENAKMPALMPQAVWHRMPAPREAPAPEAALRRVGLQTCAALASKARRFGGSSLGGRS